MVVAQKVFSIVNQMHENRRPRVLPTETALSKVIEDVFWSSLDQYEGTPIRTRIFFAPRKALASGEGIIQLEERHPISQDTIRRLSPAHTADGALIAVEDATDGLNFEGLLCSFPTVARASPLWLGVETRSSGAVRISIGANPILEVTRGSITQLGGMSFDRTAAEVLLMSARLFPVEPTGLDWHISSALLDIAFAMENYGTGGALWILPTGSSISGDMEGLGNPIRMRDDSWEPYREMWESRTSTIRLLNPGCDQGHDFLWRAAQEWDFLRRYALTKSISSLAMVDGAIVINGSPEVLAFGVICNKFLAPATKVLRSNDPTQPFIGEEVNASEFGGSRHRSAIDFCSSHSPAAALVASHDGGLTVFASLEKGCVIGSRVSLIRSDAEVKDKPA
jgi:hypothetical protein